MIENVTDYIVPVSLTMMLKTVADPKEMSMVKRWKKEWEDFTKRCARRKQILDAIREGYDTLSELKSFTNIPQTTLVRLLIQLAGQGVIEGVKTKNGNSRIEMRWMIAE